MYVKASSILLWRCCKKWWMVEATRLVLQPLDSSFGIRCFPNSFGTIGTGRLQEISDSTGDQSLGCMVKMLRLNGLQMTYDVQALITEVGRWRSHVLQNEALVLAILALAKPRRLGFPNQPFFGGNLLHQFVADVVSKLGIWGRTTGSRITFVGPCSCCVWRRSW